MLSLIWLKKISVLCDEIPCSLKEFYRRFGSVQLPPSLEYKMEAATSSEMAVHFCQTTRLHISENSNLQEPNGILCWIVNMFLDVL